MRKRAFTLIELLVVIAIIAILAAILFPVFAQAKAAAKKAASISNQKQNALAAIMYSTDYDDVNPIYISWADGPGAPAYIAGHGCYPWSWNTQPYMKNADIELDPQAPPIQVWPGWSSVVYKAFSTVYGYNYSWLSAPFCAFNDPCYTPISTTAVAQPAETVMFSAKWSTGEWKYGPAQVVWYGAPRGLIVNFGVDMPDCYTIPQWCWGNWGVGDLNFQFILDPSRITAGVRTGGNSIRAGNAQIIGWCDGHVAAKQPGAMAAGTNWNMNLAAGSLIVNDINKYLWDDK
jgi:prepilin-type N-terminal cleavage/methylation domain-containing protein